MININDISEGKEMRNYCIGERDFFAQATVRMNERLSLLSHKHSFHDKMGKKNWGHTTEDYCTKQTNCSNSRDVIVNNDLHQIRLVFIILLFLLD